MPRETWSVHADDRVFQAEVDHTWWGRTDLRIDGALVLRFLAGFGGLADLDHWFGTVEYSAALGRHELRVRVGSDNTIDLVVDGRSATTGNLVAALPPTPTDLFYRIGRRGMTIAVLAMPYVFITTFAFGRFAPAWGPRWFAANDLVLASGLLPFLTGAGIYFVNLVRIRTALFTRIFNGAFGVMLLAIAATTVMGLPDVFGDVIGEPVTTAATIVTVVPPSKRPPAVLTSDGSRFEWAPSFGFYDQARIQPGRYEVTLTPVRHLVVRVRPIG